MSNSQAEQETPWDKMGISTAPTSSIHKIMDILWNMEKRITLCLVGDTGIGKSPIVRQWGDARGAHTYVLNFGHVSQEEVSMAMFNEDGTEFGFVCPSWLRDLNKQAEEKKCAILFLDEWNRSDKNLVNALFTLTDDRRIHDFHLHENVIVVAAMNPSEGMYLVNEAEKDPAVRKRLNFVFVTHDIVGWVQHARKNDYHPLVIDYVRAAAQHFYDVGARDAGKAFPCPANWEKVSGILKSAEASGVELTDSSVRALVAGQIGRTTMTTFMEYVRDNNTLIQPNEILYEYRAKARKRVAAMLGAVLQGGELVVDESLKLRADVLSILSEGIAMTLYSDYPDPEKVAPELGDFLADLPSDIFMSFTAEHMRKYAAAAGSRGQQYTASLSHYLQQNPRYTAAVLHTQRSKGEISRALRKSS